MIQGVSPQYVIHDETHLWKGGQMKYGHKDWFMLTPYKIGYTIKVPVLKDAMAIYLSDPGGPLTVTPEYSTYQVMHPPHEMRTVKKMRLIDSGMGVATIELDNGSPSGPYYLDTKSVRGVWFKKPEPIEIQPGQYINNGYMMVWWLCNGSACCGGNDQPVKDPPQITQVEEKPLIAVDKMPTGGAINYSWGNPPTPEQKLERLMKKADPETRRQAQQILEDASDILLVDGWTKGAYHRDNKTKQSKGIS